MITQQNLVARFMESFGQPFPSEPTMPKPGVITLRYDLIKEEADELLFAETLVEYLDAICDLLYVVYGAANAAGLNAVLVEAAFLEVHRSNMSKLWTQAEKDAYKDGDMQWTPRFDQWIAKRDGKVIKSPSYSPADLKRFVERR
jgi:predicted HAD superfamily Cof-like phosphohydrolase